MEILDTYWSDPTFRKSAGDLLRLTPAQMQALRNLTDKTFEVPGDVGTQFGLDPAEFRFALILLRALYVGARDEGESAILDQLGRLAATRTDSEATTLANNLESKRREFAALLEFRPQVELNARRGAVQRSGMAALEDVNFYVDLRIADDGADWKVVPVILARLNFDEPVQVGANSVTFQIPDAILATLKQQLDRAQMAADDARKRLGDQVL
jgi:hypothetical protein